jgi:hypothetical protein
MIHVADNFNQKLKSLVLDQLRKRIQHALALKLGDFIPIPVYFEPVPRIDKIGTVQDEDLLTVAKTVGCVNLQVVNGHLLLPRPHGPRLPAAQVQQVIVATLAQLRLKRSNNVRVVGTDGFWFWRRPDMTIDYLAAVFTDVPDRAPLVDAIRKQVDGPAYVATGAKPSTSVVGGIRSAVLLRKSEILSHKKNNGLRFQANGELEKSWHRIWIPENTVDLVECFIATILAHLGQSIHFVDDWEYHNDLGELHCGTNVIRSPPNTDWWDCYHPDHEWYKLRDE